MEELVALYSEKASKEYGTVIYETEDGKLIECTAVVKPGNESNYLWEDAVNLGPVKKYICKGKSESSFFKIIAHKSDYLRSRYNLF